MIVDECALAPRLLRILPEVVIDRATRTAVVGERKFQDDTFAALEQQLTDGLYAVFHAGQKTGLEKKYLKRDRRLENAFACVVPHSTTHVTAAFRGLRTQAQQLLVELEGVLVWLPRSTTQDAPLPAIGSPIRLQLPPVRPVLSPGFQVVKGSRPADVTDTLLRVYVHVTDADHAIVIWQAVLECLEEAGVAYQAKILSRAPEYPRRDALVVYLPLACAHADQLIVDAVMGMPGIAEDTSVFAERLAPGVAKAWEPTDTRHGMSGLSFGQHRSKVLASALLGSVTTGEPRELAVTKSFMMANIDPGNPALNILRHDLAFTSGGDG